MELIKEKWDFIKKIKVVAFFINHGLIGSAAGVLKILILAISAISGGKMFKEWVQGQSKRITERIAAKKSPSKSSVLEKENAVRLLEQFKNLWFEGDNNLQDDESKRIQKQIFFSWMETNYQVHLEEHEKNKRKYFKNAHQGSRYQSITVGAHKTAAVIGGFLTFAASSAFGLKTIWGYLTNDSTLKGIPEWGQVILFSLASAIVVLTGLYIFRVLFQVEHIKQMDRIDQRKETWLRHYEAIQNYQREMICYIAKSGKYGKFLAKEDNDLIFMDQIIDVWNKNGDKFLNNMSKTLNTEDKNESS